MVIIDHKLKIPRRLQSVRRNVLDHAPPEQQVNERRRRVE